MQAKWHFSFNKNIRDFSLNSGGFRKPLFDRFVACNLFFYPLSLALANPCFRSVSGFCYYMMPEVVVPLSLFRSLISFPIK